MTDKMELASREGAVALVTGGGGELGLDVARRFLANGYRVALFEKDEEAAVAAAGRLGQGVMALAADQADRAAIDSAVLQVEAVFGRIDAVVANAGYAKFGSILDMPATVWERHVAINLNGTFHVCQAAGRVMARAKRPGSIVVISSALALTHADDVAAYCTSKAALLPMVRSMAAELGIYQIRVNAVLPGVIETAMTGEMLQSSGVRDDLLERTPIGRLGRTGDIANAVEFLCSDQATFITGSSLTVDGGQSIYGEPRWHRQDRSRPFAPRSTTDLGNRSR